MVISSEWIPSYPSISLFPLFLSSRFLCLTLASRSRILSLFLLHRVRWYTRVNEMQPMHKEICQSCHSWCSYHINLQTRNCQWRLQAQKASRDANNIHRGTHRFLRSTLHHLRDFHFYLEPIKCSKEHKSGSQSTLDTLDNPPMVWSRCPVRPIRAK